MVVSLDMPSLHRLFQGLITLVALPIAAMCALAALAGLGGGLSPWLDTLTHFTPMWIVGGLITAALSVFGLPDFPRRALLFYAGLAVVASLPLVIPEYIARTDPAPSDSPDQIRIVQFNAWSDRNADVEGSLAWLLSAKADAIVMPEPPNALVKALRAEGYHLSCYDRGDTYCGTALLSRARPLSRGVVERNDGHTATPLALAVLPAPGGGTYSVIGVHMVWPTQPRQQARQRQRLSDLIERAGPRERIIVAGDFNSTPWSFARRHDDQAWGLERRTRGVFTWPTSRVALIGPRTPLPILPIDHIYAGSDWRTVSVTRGPRLGSDHFPVLAVLALQPRGLQVDAGR